jgi:hypothetical protein
MHNSLHSSDFIKKQLMCLPMRAHNIRHLVSSLGARRHVRGALTTLFNIKRVVQREEKGQSGLIKGFYPQQTSLVLVRKCERHGNSPDQSYERSPAQSSVRSLCY